MWENLTMKEKAALIKLGVANKIRNIEDIRSVYNEYANGGKIGPTYNKKTKRWYNSEGKQLLLGKGYWSKGANKYVMYGSDGSVTKYTPEEWAHKKNIDIRNTRKKLEDNYAIPAIQDKKVILQQNVRNGKNLDRGAVVYTNMLDSIAKYGKMAGVPMKESLGLVAQESTFGNAENRGLGNFYDHPNKNNTWSIRKGDSNSFSPVVISSDWSYINDNPYTEYVNTASRNNKWIEGRNYMENRAKQFDNLMSTPPLLHAMKYYKSGNYNTGDRNYKSKVIKRGEELMQSPQIIKWRNQSKFAY